ncbi:MAG: acyl-CoA dehydrogenase family protein, partial [Myxococcota bacterium]
EFSEVFLNDVRTPKDWIVGKRGEGWLVSRTTLKHERNSIGNAAQSLGLLDALVELAKSRKIDGQAAIKDAGIRRELVRIEGYIRAHQYSGFLQTSKGLKGEDPGIIGMMNKLNSTNIGHRVALLAMEILGEDGNGAPLAAGLGMASTRPTTANWITQYMGSLGIAIAGGTANVQRNVIAERGLGLPRDAAANRGR